MGGVQPAQRSGADWLLVNVLAATIAPVLELAKWMERRGWFGRLD